VPLTSDEKLLNKKIMGKRFNEVAKRYMGT
jgi:hypothetical protein